MPSASPDRWKGISGLTVVVIQDKGKIILGTWVDFKYGAMFFDLDYGGPYPSFI